MILYKPSDRIPIELGEFTVTLAPLDFAAKSDVFEAEMKGGKETFSHVDYIKKSIAYSVKKLDGPEHKLWDGKKFQLEFEGDKLTNDCVEVLLDLPGNTNLIKAINAIGKKEDLKKAGVKLAQKGGASKNAKGRS